MDNTMSYFKWIRQVVIGLQEDKFILTESDSFLRGKTTSTRSGVTVAWREWGGRQIAVCVHLCKPTLCLCAVVILMTEYATAHRPER